MNARERVIADICTKIYDISGLIVSYESKKVFHKTTIIFSGSVEDCELVVMSILWAVTQLDEEKGQCT